MQYSHKLYEATLIRRYKRFLADVELPDGSQITLHCPNTGSMKNCLFPGHKVWYSDSGNPKRKYPCTWEQAEIPVAFDGKIRMTRAGLNTGVANKIVEECLVQQQIPELSQYESVSREVKYGEENSRIDFLLRQDGLPDCYVEVKSVTLAEGNGLGLFPDSVTSRGAKHLRELSHICSQGGRAVLLFCVQHTGIDRVSPADQIDQDYGKELRKAMVAGVEIIAWGAVLNSDSIKLTRSLPVIIDDKISNS